LALRIGKNGVAGLVQLSLLLPSPTPAEFCNDDNNSVIIPALDALRNSKKITFLSENFIFLFEFFNLILNAPRSFFFHYFFFFT
jgi:hypothetical protein